MRSRASDYLDGPAAKSAVAQLDNPATWIEFARRYANDLYVGPTTDVDGFVAGKVAPVDVDRREIDADVYAALPAALQPRSDTDVGTIVLIRWSDVASTQEYTGGAGKVRIPFGRSGRAVVIHRAPDRIVSAMDIHPESGPMLVQASRRGYEGKLSAKLADVLLTLSRRSETPFPRAVLIRGVLEEGRGIDEIVVIKWHDSDDATMRAYSPFDFPPQGNFGRSGGDFYVRVVRPFAEKSWQGGYGEYALGQLSRPTGLTSERRLTRILARFRIDPGMTEVSLGTITR